jgi:hypothetical protein
MIVAHYIEKNVEVLNLLHNSAPSVGDAVVIKGRKGKVLSIKQINEMHVHVQVELEAVKKNQLAALDPKKKKR